MESGSRIIVLYEIIYGHVLIYDIPQIAKTAVIDWWSGLLIIVKASIPLLYS
jgi:hypothetical protein